MKIRNYREADAVAVGRLIATTYRKYNLSHTDPEEQNRLLGPFQHAFSEDEKHQQTIRAMIQSPVVFVAEEGEQIVGVLRGRDHVIASLFVDGNHHHAGIGRKLVARFETDFTKKGIDWIRVAATLFAVPFYHSLGYKKTTGIRPCKSFDGTDLTYQPMKKRLM